MRRHTVETERTQQQIKSVLTSPTRKFFHFANNSSNSNGIINFVRRTRRHSEPQRKQSDRSETNNQLHTIDEVSKINMYIPAHLLYRFICMRKTYLIACLYRCYWSEYLKKQKTRKERKKRTLAAQRLGNQVLCGEKNKEKKNYYIKVRDT